MRIRSLELFRFRNLADQTIALPGRITLIVGNNGQGKTSLLEAIYLLSHAKSFRTSAVAELVRWDAPRERSGTAVKVAATVETLDGQKRVAWALEGGSRAVYVHDKRVHQASSFYGQVLTLLFTPDELQLVRGAPALRRSFIDRLIAMTDPQYVDSIVAYQRVIKQRNSLLLAARQRRDSTAKLAGELQTWDVLLARHALLVVRKRKQLFEELNPGFQASHDALLGRRAQPQRVDCRYSSDFLEQGAVLSEEEVLARLGASLERDAAQGVTSLGAHRDDVHIYLDAGSGLKPARRTASQGQSRTLALALKLAALGYVVERTGEHPVVLLDDVESELDQERREALYELLSGIDSQVLITATEVGAAFHARFTDTGILRLSEGLAELASGG